MMLLRPRPAGLNLGWQISQASKASRSGAATGADQAIGSPHAACLDPDC